MFRFIKTLAIKQPQCLQLLLLILDHNHLQKDKLRNRYNFLNKNFPPEALFLQRIKNIVSDTINIHLVDR